MKRTRSGFVWLRAAFVTLICLFAARASAQDQCNPVELCETNGDCRNGRICVAKSCEVPCDSNAGGAPTVDPGLCQWGETCVRGTGSSGARYYCEAAAFGMDLNLLDSCIYHFLEGVPVEQGQTACSLESRLAQMMGDGKFPFDIFDLDLCIKNFLDQPPCDSNSKTCPVVDGVSLGVYCDADAQCGQGLYCNTELHRCERECGFIHDRSLGADQVLERECARPLHACNYERGRCEPINLGDGDSCSTQDECPDGSFCSEGRCQLTCEIDRDCPSGAYCALGQCQPKCFRSLECPDSTWFCDASNRCQPKPSTGAVGSSDPSRYLVRFAESNVLLDLFNDSYELPLLIMDQISGKQELKDSSLVFGYRLEARYGLKRKIECQGDLTGKPALQDECFIDSTEYFLTQDKPFGRVFGDTPAQIPVRVDHARADKLTPGEYPVTLTAYFSNGSSTSLEIVLRKPAPSGKYSGRLSMYVGGSGVISEDGEITNHFGDGTVSMDLFVDSTRSKTWDQLTRDNRVEDDQEFVDLTFGQVVTGFLNGNESTFFDSPNADRRADNRIRVTGIYSPAKGRLRLLGVIDVEKDYCRTQSGKCPTSGTLPALVAQNPFDRKVRRVFQFIGPFDARTGLFHGLYRELVSGLAPSDVTLEGGFRLQQMEQRDDVIADVPLLNNNAGVNFLRPTDLVAEANKAVNATCGMSADTKPENWTGDAALFRNVDAYLCYTQAEGKTCSFPQNAALGSTTRFFGALGSALEALKTAPGTRSTLYKHLQDNVKICDGKLLRGEPAEPGCVDLQAVQCGLALYRKAFVEGWVDGGSAAIEQEALAAKIADPGRKAVLFCPARAGSGNAQCPASRGVPADACGDPRSCVSGQAHLFALQEHGSFYRDVVGRQAYEGANAVSEAFFAPYTAVRGSGSTMGAAFDAKRAKLNDALRWYAGARASMFSPVATAVLFGWPADVFPDQSQEWIDQMQATLLDRVDALIELADLERRAYDDASEKRFILAHHVLHLEYLQHVLLGALEANWEGGAFVYAGGGQEMLKRGDVFMAKSDESRNPLGLLPNRVYFGNPNPQITNTQFLAGELAEELDATDSTTLAGLVQGARGAMEASLNEQNQLEEAIRNARDQLRNELDQLCGPVQAFPSACTTNLKDKEAAAACEGKDCLFEYRCESSVCSDVSKVFSSAAAGQVECRADVPPYKVSDEHGQPRDCVRGELGNLVQQRVALELRRKQVMRNFHELVRQISRQQAYVEEVRAINDEISDEIRERDKTVRHVNQGLAAADLVYETAVATADALKCMVLGGLAVGTDCPQSAIAGGLKIAAIEVKGALHASLEALKADAVDMANQRIGDLNADKELLVLYNQLDGMVADVANRVSDYETVVLELYNLDLRIADTHYLAQRSAERYRDTLEQQVALVERMTGWKASEKMRRNAKVVEANARFRDTLVLAYELAQGLRHELNLNEDKAHLVKLEDVYKIVTLDDLEAFVRKVNDITSRDACKVFHDAGIGECQGWSNTNRYTMSIQLAMYPELRDVVDASSGRMLTVGSQFHNRITASSFVRKRLHDGTQRLQIELPFGVWQDELDTIIPPHTTSNLTKGQCNMLIEPAGVSVQVVGSNMSFDLPVTLKRGATEYQRSCFPGPAGAASKRPIESYTVGWLPGTAGEQSGGAFESSMDFQNTVFWGEDRSFRTAFRDRSLATPNYLLVIPLEGKALQLLNPLDPSAPPQVHDIRIHFKYRAVTF